MEPAEVFAVLTAAIFLLISLGYAMLFEYRAQQRQKDEQQRELLLALFRISKQHTKHVDALGVVLLRALRQGNADPVLIAEVKREIEQARLPQGQSAPPAELPPRKPGGSGAEE